MDLSSPNADIALIAACQQGDARAFRRVFEMYRDRVYALCTHMAPNEQDAEDLTQEIFVQAFRNVGTFRAESAFSTWLYRIAANRCLAEARKRRPAFSSLETVAQKNMPIARTANPEEQLIKKELVKRAEEAISGLPESMRLVFVLGTQVGMPYREIGEILSCSEDAVKVRIHRARKRVRDALRPYLES